MNPQERRNGEYLFQNLNTLQEFFGQFFAPAIVKVELACAARGFVKRKDASEEVTRLQLLKKCHFRLVRRLQGCMAPAARPQVKTAAEI